MKFLNNLSVNFLGTKKWQLTSSLSFEFEGDDVLMAALQEYGLGDDFATNLIGNGILIVPVNFVTDLASIPRACWALIAPWDVARAAVVHDLLYKRLRVLKQEGLSSKDVNRLREVADHIFLMGMQASKPPVPDWKIIACHKAVRTFGRFVI